MSNASRWYPVEKSHQDHQGSQREQFQILVTFQIVPCISSKSAPAYGLSHGYVTILSDSQGCQISHFDSLYITIDGNPAFTVHATAHAFRAAINL